MLRAWDSAKQASIIIIRTVQRKQNNKKLLRLLPAALGLVRLLPLPEHSEARPDAKATKTKHSSMVFPRAQIHFCACDEMWCRRELA